MRTVYQRDSDRIIHAKAFRRLKDKTQVFVANQSDHVRSRLTHTIEVVRISRYVAQLLRLNDDLCEAIALAHDLGHPPFGHSGEQELNQLAQYVGGFDHNQQSRRVVDCLEKPYPHFLGLNLTYEVREGLLKTAPSGTTTPSLEAQVVDLADEMTYTSHDIDDGLSSGLLDSHQLMNTIDIWMMAAQSVAKQGIAASHHDHQRINSGMITMQMNDVVNESFRQIKAHHIVNPSDIHKAPYPLIRFSDRMRPQHDQLRRYLFHQLYFHGTIQHMNQKGCHIIRSLYQMFLDDVHQLPESYRKKISDKQATTVPLLTTYPA